MQKLISFFNQKALYVFIFVLLTTVFFAKYIPQLIIDPSSDGLMIKDDPQKEFYEQTLEKFGSDNVVVIYLKDKEMFSVEKVQLLAKLINRLEDYKYTQSVHAVFNQKNIIWRDGGLITEPFIDTYYPPQTEDEVIQFKNDALYNPILQNNLLNDDATVMSINVNIEPNEGMEGYDSIIKDDINQILTMLDGEIKEYFQIGSPYFKSQLIDYIISDQLTLIPISVALLFIVLLISLRSFANALLPLVTSSISVIWTFGFMAIFDIPINLITVIIPSLLIVIGATEDTHMASEYMEGIRKKKIRKLAIEYMGSKIGLAILLTAATTVAGFASIIANDIVILRQFGIVTVFALVSNFLITMSFVPAYLHFFGTKHPPKEQDHARFAHVSNIIDKYFAYISAKKVPIIAVVSAVTLLMAAGIFQIKINNDTISYFKESSDIRQKSDIVDRELSGVQSFYLTVDANEKNAFKKPHFLQELERISNKLKSVEKFDKVIGVNDHISLMNREMHEGDKSFYKIPDNEFLIQQYLLMFHENDLSSYVTSDYSEANIVVKHNITSSYELNALTDELQTYFKKHIDPSLELTFTGEKILVNQAADTIAKGQAFSLIIILVIIFILMSALFVNIKAGLLSIVPNLIPIFFVFGVMGYFGIDLNIGTAMVAAIAIGIAVDDTIHLMVRYNKEMKLLNDQDLAIKETLKHEFRPVFSTSIALFLGFSVLVVSNFIPVIYFGMLSALVMLLALICDFLITPILLSSTRLITLWDMIAFDLKENVFKSKIFKGMKRWHIKKLILSSNIKTVKAHEHIIKQGQRQRSFFLILDGQAYASINYDDQSKKLKTFYPGDIFGEIALSADIERTADVIAQNDCTLLEFDWQSLEKIGKIMPNITSRFFLNLSGIMGVRLAETTDSLIHKDS
ncbi:MAG: efflux RND transporter permease subunit [Campylobacterota bacterium]